MPSHPTTENALRRARRILRKTGHRMGRWNPAHANETYNATCRWCKRFAVVELYLEEGDEGRIRVDGSYDGHALTPKWMVIVGPAAHTNCIE